jgi:microcystin degradation protein MlrC
VCAWIPQLLFSLPSLCSHPSFDASRAERLETLLHRAWAGRSGFALPPTDEAATAAAAAATAAAASRVPTAAIADGAVATADGDTPPLAARNIEKEATYGELTMEGTLQVQRRNL